jgi:AmiR/NasT family two-component response regulator
VPAIEMAMSRFAELTELEHEVSNLTDRLEVRKLVDRAKGVLQSSLSVTEPEAFRWVQKTAMDLRLSMREVAQGVIEHGPALGAAGRSDPQSEPESDPESAPADGDADRKPDGGE